MAWPPGGGGLAGEHGLGVVGVGRPHRPEDGFGAVPVRRLRARN